MAITVMNQHHSYLQRLSTSHNAMQYAKRKHQKDKTKEITLLCEAPVALFPAYPPADADSMGAVVAAVAATFDMGPSWAVTGGESTLARRP